MGLFWEGVRGVEGQGKNMKSTARTMQKRGKKEGSKETHEIADLGGDLSPRVGPNWASKNADTGGDFVQKN